MKILLLTDIPPDRGLTAGIVLDRMCRFLPPGSIACFAVVNPVVTTKLAEDLPGVPTMLVDKPREDGLSEFGKKGSFRRKVAERLRGFHDRNFAVPSLVNQAAKFARTHKVDAVWAVLQGQTIIHMARPLARKLGVPLFTHVWDPVSWWLKSFEVDKHGSKLAKREFDRAILASRAVCTASWAMTEEYDQKYRVYSVPVIASHDRAIAKQPAPKLHTDGELVIGMAGQFYARSEWDALIAALNACKWVVAGRHVRINVAGHHVPPTDAPAAKITKLGWLGHTELVQRLSECDILYCPYPFEKDMDEVSRLSFPSKLVAYLAAGRPTVFHGPKTASPARYVANTETGLIALGPQATAIYNVIHRLATDEILFRRCCENAHHAFLRDFTFESMRSSFFQFLRINRPDDFPLVNSPGFQPAGHPGSSAEPAYVSQVIDRRSARLRQKRLKLQGQSRDHWKLRLLRRSGYVRNLEGRNAELSDWQDVHRKELTALYEYVRVLTEDIGAHKAAFDRQALEGENRLLQKQAEFSTERDALREHIALRDQRISSLIALVEYETGEAASRAAEVQRVSDLIEVERAAAETRQGRLTQALGILQADYVLASREAARAAALDSQLAEAAKALEFFRDLDLKNKIQLRRNTAEWEAEIQQAREEARQAWIKTDRLDKQIAEKQLEVDALASLVKAQDEALTNVRSEWAKNAEDMTAAIDQAVRRSDELDRNCATATEAIDMAEARAAALVQQLEEARRQIADLSQSQEAVRIEAAEQIDSYLRAHAEDLRRLQGEQTVVINKVHADRDAALEEMLSESELRWTEKLSALEEQLAAQVVESAQLRSAAEEAYHAIEKFSREADLLKSAYEAAREEVGQLGKARDEALRRQDELHLWAAQCEEAQKVAECRAGDLSSELEKVVRRLQDAQENILQVTQERDHISQRGHEEALAFSQRQIAFNIETASLRTSAAHANEALQEASALRQSIAVYMAEIAALTEERNQIRAASDVLTAHVRDLQSDISAFEARSSDSREVSSRAAEVHGEIQVARALAEENVAALMIVQQERDELARHLEAEAFASENERDVLFVRVTELEAELAHAVAAAADAERMRIALSEKEGEVARLTMEQEIFLSRLSSDSARVVQALSDFGLNQAAGQQRMEGLIERVLDQSESESAKTTKKRLSAVRKLLKALLDENVRGDFASVGLTDEAEVSAMRQLLRARDDAARKVWVVGVADVARGNIIRYPADRGPNDARAPTIRQTAFAGDGQVKFLANASETALKEAGVNQLAFVHFQADDLRSLDAFASSYARLSPGGVVLVSSSRGQNPDVVVTALRETFGVVEEIFTIAEVGVHWTRVKTPRARSKSSRSTPAKAQATRIVR